MMIIVLLSLLTLSAFSAINTNIFVQADDTQQSYSCSGQIAVAHWEAIDTINTNNQNKIDIDAIFAEQLETDTGVTLQNALYIKVMHATQGVMISGPISLDDVANAQILQDASGIKIEAYLMFTYGPDGTRSGWHTITLDWHIADPCVLFSSSGDSADSFIALVPASGEFYNAEAEITISRQGSNHVDTYVAAWATMGKTAEDIPVEPTVSAFVTKLNGNKNDLTITVIENPTGTPNEIKKTFSINNNAAGTYQVGNYNVYVDTKGNDQIRACYIITE
jgi:hypothetical protein